MSETRPVTVQLKMEVYAEVCEPPLFLTASRDDMSTDD